MDAKRKLKILQDNYPEGTFRVYTRKWKGRDKTKYYVQTLERKGAKR
ncbi:hypothetical protein HOE37_06665 [Candidatus Woesearchaeota archaeon]|nr:hypothetical protein [Candidatus Woesearchaeota archaeon]